MHPALAKKCAQTLGVEFEQAPLAGYKCAGMACVATNRGYLAHNRISEEEASMLESLFNCKGLNGTVNSGAALVGAGACATSTGALIGEASTGFETGRIVQAFDLA
jgi:translation initiation factor 6